MNHSYKTCICQKVETTIGQFSCCGGCKLNYYCSKECQTKDWKQHRKNCGFFEKDEHGVYNLFYETKSDNEAKSIAKKLSNEGTILPGGDPLFHEWLNMTFGKNLANNKARIILFAKRVINSKKLTDNQIIFCHVDPLTNNFTINSRDDLQEISKTRLWLKSICKKYRDNFLIFVSYYDTAFNSSESVVIVLDKITQFTQSPDDYKFLLGKLNLNMNDD